MNIDENVLEDAEEASSEKNISKKKKNKKRDNEEPKPTWKVVLEYARVIAVGAFVAFLLCKFVIINAVVPTQSMVSTINVGDRLIGLRMPYYFRDPYRGEIVIFKAPEATGEEGKLYIKRVIGLPGETIEIKDGKIYKKISDTERELIDNEDWWNEAPNLNLALNRDQIIVLGEDEYFMAGDNRNHSSDSRVWGAVKRKAIIAKGWLKYYKGFKILK